MATKNTTPIPRDEIKESFVWRDWFQRLSDRVYGTLSSQDATNVAITGGSITNSTINNSSIGSDIPSTGSFTSLKLKTPLAIVYGGTNNKTTPTAGAVVYGTGAAYAFTAAGTTGQVLTSAGAGTPTWVTGASGSFKSADATPKTITVVNGIITSIV